MDGVLDPSASRMLIVKALAATVADRPKLLIPYGLSVPADTAAAAADAAACVA